MDVADLFGVSDRVGDELALDEPVDKSAIEPFLRADRIAGRAHLQRLRDAGDARQALRATSTGEQAELHLGRAELRRRVRDAIMAGKRDLEPAAERRTVD